MSAATSGGMALDDGGAVRPGEELDVEAVDRYLKARVDGLTGAPVVTQYAGGASNWTYRLAYPSHDLVLRRPPKGTKAKSAHDMGREHRVQQALAACFAKVPEMIAFCDDERVIGAEFYVMRRVPGVIPRGRGRWSFDADITRAIALSFIDTLVELHAVDVERAGLSSLGKGKGYCRRQIDGWSGRYEKARTWNVPRFTRVRAWLDANVPDDVATCVIHGDYRLDNVVIDPKDPTRVVGVLDWELATLGDPLMDLGSSLAYWTEAGDDVIARAIKRQPSDAPGMPTRGELVARYFEQSGRAPVDLTFYEVYGMFRLAVIAQQIYYRYHHGETRNPAFKRFWLVVHYLDWRCRRRIARASTRASNPGSTTATGGTTREGS